MTQEDPQATRASGGLTGVGARYSDVDLHRIDVAAALLARKGLRPDVDGLLAHSVAETRRASDSELDAILFIAEMMRVSATLASADEHARIGVAARRLAGVLAALEDPEDVAALRGLVRRGELERTLSLAAQRRIRRACVLATPAEQAPEELATLTTTAWDTLLEALARSVAVDREADVWIDAQLAVPDAAALVVRRGVVRGVIALGERALPGPSAGPMPTVGAVTSSSSLSGDEPWLPSEREMLPPGHKVGRFTLLTRLGVGAMGVVYAAYDPELDRRIAVKLLRTREGNGAARAQARLLREAQAMARLTHPNVAVVHDVGTHEGDVFVAMEFIRGDTLQTWLRKAPRKWPEVVEVFVQAGRGLAAAHAAGLVHRDFKPTNAMIGDDARVRVLDFGLCYTEAAVDTEASGDAHVDVRITRREEVVGTPAYMPPEQFLRGGVVGPASDQFSFCASLYEALYDQLPFAGETVHSVSLAIASGELRAPPRGSRVPPWLHNLVQRGLRPNADERFPSMEALLRVLGRNRGRTRGSLAIAATLAIGTGLAGFWAARSQAVVVDPCSGGAAEIAEVWGPTRRVGPEQALVSAGPAFAEEIWPRVASDLDRYANEWQGTHREACLAHQRGETSGMLLDRRMACLARRKVALGEAVKVLSEANVEVALHALEVVNNLPTLDRCSELEALAVEVPPPADPQVRAQLEVLRPRLARVRTLDHAGLKAAALREADEVLVAAETLGEPSLLSEALLQRGRLEIHLRDKTTENEALLTRAYLGALAARLDEFAAEALALRLYVRGRDGKTAAHALDDMPVAEAMVARLPAPGRLRGLLLNNAGSVHWALGDAERGAELFREALAVREAALGVNHLEVAFTLANLAMVTIADDMRVQLMQRALTIFDDQLGRAHPQTIEVRRAASLYALDPREAEALLAPGCEALGRFSLDDRAQRALCLYYLGHHASEAGDQAAASAALREVDEIVTGVASETLPLPKTELTAMRGRAALANNRHRAAVDQLRLDLADVTEGREWWEQRHRAELQLQLGIGLQALGRRVEAGESLRAAVVGFAAAAINSRSVLVQQRLAAARVAFAAHLLAGEHEPVLQAEADALLAAAEQFYRSSGPGYAWRLPDLTALRRRTRSP